MKVKQNRRRSFRLDDELTIWFRKLDAKTLKLITQDFDQYRMKYCLKSHFIYQKEARQPKFQIIKKRDKDVAMYIQHLEQQIIQLAERLALSVDSEMDHRKMKTDVNLSADGVRFTTNQDIRRGDNIELGMELPTNATQVVVVGTVVRCTDQPDGSQSLSVEYTHIHDEDIEAIIRHMAKLQQFQLQSRRAS